ncbi:GntR family transcriptional regulator [Curtobacterium sp. RHCJP20]|uniref:GntR family transcriptional regulator n=1 Tax=Curtobacterium subtropicum TaxID=3055138 RepID=A0ABT7TJH3_9MICO|nr:GntR family transcriptional regulator [Curtobacterium subtropicum]MDM7889749.1 GntR family transcriptional regulator [Curtobacterium subtropicum]
MFASPDAGVRPRLRDQARERLRAEIMGGVLAPGTLLDDDELAGRLRCSRTPVREALSDLGHLGLVEFRANRYTRVTVPRREDLVPTLQALGLLFGGVVRTTIPEFDDRRRALLFRRLGLLLDCMAETRWEWGADAVTPVYRSFIAECDNPLLAATLSGALDGLTYRLRHDDVRAALPWEHIRNGLVALRIAVDSRDGRLAERASSRIHLLPDPDRKDR